MEWYSVHSHSKFSFNDALPGVDDMVATAVRYGYPALGLTDHGNMSGAVSLYKECRKAGIEPLPGMEVYLVADYATDDRKDTYHLTLVAYSEVGYINLVGLATIASKRFWYRPRLDMATFATLAADGGLNGIACATGCVGGPVAQTLIRSQSVEDAVGVAWQLASWFPMVFVELQHHHIEDINESGISDTAVLAGLWEVAKQSGLPVITARDSHYCAPEDRRLHDALKELVSWSDSPEDARFSGDGYHMLDTAGMAPYFTAEQFAAGQEGLELLANKAYVRIPDLETFAMKVPSVVVGDAMDILEAKVMAAVPQEQRTETYLRPLREEFDVIRSGGMAPYLLLVDKVCGFMRERGIHYAARGSASGSQVCWRLGITQIDPVALGLRFDRFLSRNRLKPPDVDLDVESTRREEVVAFLYRNWSVLPVGSHMKYSLYDEEGAEGDGGKGSLRVRYYSVLRKKGLSVPANLGERPADRKVLMELSDLKLMSGFGTHAAGYIVAPNTTVLDQLPKAWIPSSKKMVTAYDKKSVEALGFLKLDLLGLRTQVAIRLMEEATGISFADIPVDDKETFASIAAGRTRGVFQLEGWSLTKGCLKLRPRTLDDIIAAQALFRPATMNSGATDAYLARRRREEAVPARHPDISGPTKSTFGVLLYQEQVMDVMQNLGMEPAELEEMLDAVKASNEYSIGALKTIEKMMGRIHVLAAQRGWSDPDLAWLDESLRAYADYSFNRAHAAAYGIIAYRTAWMRVHQPLAFWSGVLQAFADHDKSPEYQSEARRDGIRIRLPHVNHSLANFRAEPGGALAIRQGLTAIKGVGPVAATELVANAPYSSLNDLAARVNTRKVSGTRNLLIGKPPGLCTGVIAALWEADALTDLEFEKQEVTSGS